MSVVCAQGKRGFTTVTTFTNFLACVVWGAVVSLRTVLHCIFCFATENA